LPNGDRIILTLTLESASDFASGHEDKKQHGSVTKNQPTGKKGGRKSIVSLGTPADESGLSSKEKAARRKEQNRAAQKAFRERRENKVKDVGCVQFIPSHSLPV
jgi:AP-1-like factor